MIHSISQYLRHCRYRCQLRLQLRQLLLLPLQMQHHPLLLENQIEEQPEILLFDRRELLHENDGPLTECESFVRIVVHPLVVLVRQQQQQQQPLLQQLLLLLANHPAAVQIILHLVLLRANESDTVKKNYSWRLSTKRNLKINDGYMEENESKTNTIKTKIQTLLVCERSTEARR